MPFGLFYFYVFQNFSLPIHTPWMLLPIGGREIEPEVGIFNLPPVRECEGDPAGIAVAEDKQREWSLQWESLLRENSNLLLTSSHASTAN